jgi:DNA-binding phage protein
MNAAANIQVSEGSRMYGMTVTRSPSQNRLSRIDVSLDPSVSFSYSDQVDALRESLIEGLKLSMVESNINGIDLAKITGYSRQYIYKIIKNQNSSVTIDKVLELLAAVGCKSSVSVRAPK